MASFPNPSGDLASILQTLSAYAPPAQAPPHELEDGEYDPSEYDPSKPAQLLPLPQPALPQNHQSPQPQPTPAKRPKPPSTAHIKTYPLALRHITTHLLPQPHFLPRIQHLIHTQHSNERQWYAGREKLLKQIRSRDASRKKLDEVLASVGGKAGGVTEESGLSEEEELAVYDRKVHRAQREMIGATEKELRGLGVPGFGEGEGEGEEGKTLRGRVLGLLEDLCGVEEGEG